MKPNSAEKRKNKEIFPLFSLSLIILTLLAVVAALVGPSLFYLNSRTLMNDINARFIEGQIADKDVIATQSFYYIDEKETRLAQEKAYKSTPPVFTTSLIDSKNSFNRLEKEIHTTLDSSQLSEQEKNLISMYASDIANELIDEGVFDSKELKKVIKEGYSTIKVRKPTGYTDDWSTHIRDITTLITDESVSTTANRLLDIIDPNLTTEMKEIIIRVIDSSLIPTITLHPSLTASDRAEARDQVVPVMIRVEEGEFIIKKNFVIQEGQIKTIKALRLASVQYSLLQLVGRSLFAFAIIISSIYAIHVMFSHSKRKHQIIVIYLIGLITTLIVTFLLLYLFSGKGFVWLDPFLPLFVLPLLLSLMTNKKRLGMVASLTITSLMALYSLSTVTTLFFIISISFISLYFIKYVSKRIDMIFQWILTLICATFVVLVHALMVDYSFTTILTSIAIIASNITLSYIFVAFFLPILEISLNIPTPFRLRELSNTHTKGLRKLAQVAPGTYNHSLAVADLASSAAAAIGADPLLTYVGALYHDIGKQENPEYFIENQSGDNKHNELKASLSVSIIKSHVKIGVEKGKSDKLPFEVIDIISEHHGNDIIAIFLKEAQEEAALNGTRIKVGEHDYSYNNEIPQTPESSLVMLADSVEAASRSITKPNAAKYEKLIHSIIMGKIERKQLSASRLTLNDLDDISRVFVQYLIGKNHVRMKYPTTKEA